jgi:hypothetical protein
LPHPRRRFSPTRHSCRASRLRLSMSALGQKQTFSEVCVMSALPPKADIGRRLLDVESYIKKSGIGRADVMRAPFAQQLD